MENLSAIVPPSTCPSCDATVKLVGDQLFCTGDNCQAKTLKRLEHYAKVMKIKGLGPKTLEKLSEGLCVSDIDDIYTLTEEDLIPILGEKVSKKLVGEIEGSKQTSLGTFISALSIPLIGNTAGVKIESLQNTNLETITFEQLRKVGIGEAAANSFLGWVQDKWEKLSILLPITFTTKALVTENFTVVITGVFEKSRTILKEEISKLGGVVRDSVSSKTNFLLLGESKSVSSKEKKATQLGIPIVKSMEDLIEKLEKL